MNSAADELLLIDLGTSEEREKSPWTPLLTLGPQVKKEGISEYKMEDGLQNEKGHWVRYSE